MEKVSNRLKTLFFGQIAVAIVLVVVFETGIALPGAWAGNEAREFVLLTAMELLTVALLPLALYLFRLKPVARRLKGDDGHELWRWGLLRLLMIGAPLVVNVLCHELTANASFAYLAIICAIVLCFVYPSKARCQQETAIDSPSS